ncbi:MAG: hypothetical protein WBD20_20260 [Pirellulaceae bacterium]
MIRQIWDRLPLGLISAGLQLDRTLGAAIATRLWQAFAGPLTLILLIRSLTLGEQGVYYALTGIVSIQAYFELGLLNVLVSHSGHQMAGVDQADDQAKELASARMRDLIRSSFRWFGMAALLYLATALGFGWFTLWDSQVSWQLPLLALIPVAAISVWLAPAMSILEGAGQRDLVYRIRFLQMVIGSLCVWIALALDLKLWALVVSAMVQAVVLIYVRFVMQIAFFSRFEAVKRQASDFVWTRDIVPMQWRMALIGMTFHFATQFFTIIVIKFHSDVEAGPLGMTLSLTSAIQMLALAWVQTKYPVVSNYHGAGNRELAGTLWRRTAIVSTALLVVACLSLMLLIAALPMLDRGIEKNFLQPWQVGILSIGCLGSHIASVQGFYVLSRKANPLLAASLIGSITTAILVWCGGYMYSTNGVITGYAIGMMLILVPVHTWAYLRFRQ